MTRPVGSEISKLGFYWAMYKVALKARTEYRVDFIVAIATALMTQLSALAFYWVIFARFPTLGGWPAPAVLFLFGMTAMVLGLSELFLNGIWMLPWYIVGGEMDRVLLYPVRSLLFVLMARPELHALGNLGLGVALLSSSFHQLSLPSVALLLVPVWVVSGMLIYTAALVAMGCLCFRIVGHWATHLMFVHHLLHAGRYPISIYPRWLQVVLLSVFPIGVATFVPGRWLFGQTSLWVVLVVPPLVAALSVWVAFRLWDVALKYYQSTGS